jgi:hypothetical protein
MKLLASAILLGFVLSFLTLSMVPREKTENSWMGLTEE